MLQRLLILTGDPSADIHAAHVVEALRATNPGIEIAAVGGPRLAETGVTLVANHDKMGRVGFGSFWGAWDHVWLGKRILDFCKRFQPQAVLMIDYGVFHLWMARFLKPLGYRIHYFIPPQVWASRRHRIHKIKRYVDHVFCMFPFEEALYQAHGIPVTYVGHPLLSQLPPPADRQDFCAAHGLDPDAPIIGLFPGSRKMEIDYLLTPIVQAARIIRERVPDAQFVLAKAASLKADYFARKLREASDGAPEIRVLENANHAVMSVSDALIAASGTVTLEAALYQTPMVITYKGHPAAHRLVLWLCDLPYIGLPNILSCIPDINHPHDDIQPPVVPELLQNDANPQSLAEHLLPLLDPGTPEARRARQALQQIREKLGGDQPPAAHRLAEALLKT